MADLQLSVKERDRRYAAIRKELRDNTAKTVEAAGAAVPAAPGNPLRATCNWFLSKTVRHASAVRKHVQKILNHQRDILSPQAITAVEGALAELQRAIANTPQKEVLEQQLETLEKSVNDSKKGLKPYPNAGWRENFEVLLVALTVAMGIRTFFLQPFKFILEFGQPGLQFFKIPGLRDFFLENDLSRSLSAHHRNLSARPCEIHVCADVL